MKPSSPLKEEPALADKFIATTYKEPKRLFNGRWRKEAEDIMFRYRQDIRKAHRFVLDREFVQWATVMATAPAERILARLQYATLPYETTWIEFDLHEKMRTIGRIHRANTVSLKDVAPRCGCLLQRINETDSLCTLVSEIDDAAAPHMCSYFFSTIERPMPQMKHYGCTAFEGRDSRATLWGFTHRETPVITPGKENLVTPKFLERHGDVATSRMFQFYRMLMAQQGKPDKMLADAATEELKQFTGHMRWIVTVLAMMNEVPVYAEHVVSSHQQRIDHVRKKQLVDYHRVSLRLPKIKPQVFLERHLNGTLDRRHRAHEVRTHWRTYLHEAHCSAETHDWEYDHENGYRLCGKCMAYGRRIDEHIRGNPELGWVRKDYVIKKEKYETSSPRLPA